MKAKSRHYLHAQSVKLEGRSMLWYNRDTYVRPFAPVLRLEFCSFVSGNQRYKRTHSEGRHASKFLQNSSFPSSSYFPKHQSISCFQIYLTASPNIVIMEQGQPTQNFPEEIPKIVDQLSLPTQRPRASSDPVPKLGGSPKTPKRRIP